MKTTGMAKMLINASRIKYIVLEKLFQDIKIRQNTVNLFIDASALFYRMYRDEVIEAIYANDSTVTILEMTVAVINTIAHYRNYISSRLHRKNRIFLVVNRKKPKYQEKQYPGYGNQYYDMLKSTDPKYGQLNTMIKKALEHIQSILPYFEDIFYIDADGVEECAAIQYLLNCDAAKNCFNIIYTRNEMAYQMLKENELVVIKPKRDFSRLITAKTWANEMLDPKTKYRPGIIPPMYVPIYLAIRGLSCRGIVSGYVRGPVNTMKLIQKVSGAVNMTAINVQTFFDQLEFRIDPYQFPSDEEIEEMGKIFSAIHVGNAFSATTEAQRTRISSGTYNQYDQIGLENINNMLVQVDEVLELRQLSCNVAR